MNDEMRKLVEAAKKFHVKHNLEEHCGEICLDENDMEGVDMFFSRTLAYASHNPGLEGAQELAGKYEKFVLIGRLE